MPISIYNDEVLLLWREGHTLEPVPLSTVRCAGTENDTTCWANVGGAAADLLPNLGPRWTDRHANGSQHHSFQSAVPLQSLSAPDETSGAQEFDFEQFVDFDRFTAPEDEPQNQFPPGISQLVDDGTSPEPQPQLFQDYSDTHVQYRSPSSPYIGETTSSASSMLPLTDWSTPSTCSLPDTAESQQMPGTIERASKLQLPPFATSLACSTRPKFKCDACPRKTFTLAKDLKRHQASASSCPAAAKQQKKRQFTRTCGSVYTRKDTLLRHLQRANARDGDAVHTHFLVPRA